MGSGRILPVIVVFLLGFAPAARAQQESSSSLSADSTQGSSEESTQNSTRDSSRSQKTPDETGGGGGGGGGTSNSDSGETTRQTTNDSIDGTTDGTRGSTRDSSDDTRDLTKDSSKSQSNGYRLTNTGAALIIAAAVVAVGAGVLYTYRDQLSEAKPDADLALAKYLERYHAFVVRDVALGNGPLITEWLLQCGLSENERQAFLRRFAGSPRRSELLKVLNGNIDAARAQRFAIAFAEVLTADATPQRVDGMLRALSVDN